MSETSQMLKDKASELEAAVDEVQTELARADATRASEPHRRLAATVREAREWLDARKGRPDPQGDAAAAETQKAEALLHEIRTGRGRI